ncbi:MAG: hypothetical protein N3F09_09685, partial [Bacteroidia bacterium]|nr:hypothetical protein [Bacteroidia bacterium]
VTFFVFATPTALSPEQQSHILADLNAFLSSWKSHGMPVRALARWEKNHFLCVEVDASCEIPGGCSKDALFRTIQELEKNHSLSLLDRSYVYFESEKSDVVAVEWKALESFINSHNSRFWKVYDLTVLNSSDWKNQPRPLEESWLQKVLTLK